MVRTQAVLALLILFGALAGTVAAQAAPSSSGGAGLTGAHPTYALTVSAGDTLANVTVTIEDLADSDQVTITAIGGTAPAGITIAPASLPTALAASAVFQLTGTVGGAATPGPFVFTIDYEDDEPLSGTQITVTLTLSNTAPVLAGPSGLADLSLGGSDPNFTATCIVGDDLAATFNATDANTGQTLTTTVSVTAGTLSGAAAGFNESFPFAPAGAVSPHAVSVTGTALAAGTITLTVLVSDGTGSDTYTLAITISAANVNPVLAAPSGTVGLSVGGSDPNFTATATVGGNLAVTFNATDANGADVLTTTVSVTGGTLSGAAAGFNESFPFAPAGTTSPHGVSLTGTALAAGTITLTIGISDGAGGTDTYTLAITISAAGTPTISVVGTLTAFTTTGTGIPSAQQSYNVSGSNLTGNISIVPPAQFQISTVGGGGFTPTNPITLVQAGGTVASTQIFVRYNPAVAGPHSGNITHTSTGATTQNQAVSGSIAAPAAAALTAGSGNPGAQNASPGSTRTGLVFRLAETGGGSPFTVTTVTVTIATTNNAGSAAISRLSSVALRRGGTLLGTVTNPSGAFVVAGDNVTVNFTGISSAINPSTSADFTVSLTFTGAAVPSPAPLYLTSIANTGVNGGASVTGALVTGGQITLAESLPDDPFAEDEDDNSCDLSTRGGPAWPLLLAVAVVAAAVVRRRRGNA